MNKGVIVGLVLIVVVGIVGSGVWMASNNKQTGSNSLEKAQPTANEDTLTPVDTTSETMEDTSTAVATGKVVEIEVMSSNFKFVPNKIEVSKGDTVRVLFKNSATMAHTFVIDEFEVATSQIGEDEEEEVEFVASKTGSFEFYCSIGNHRAMGMKGTLVVK